MNKTQRADAVFKSLRDYVAKKNMNFDEKNNRTLIVKVRGADNVINASFFINEEFEEVAIYSLMPFELDREKTVDLIMACAFINNKLAIGKYYVDADSGSVIFRSNEMYAGLSGFGDEYAEQLVMITLLIAEKWDEKLEELNSGSISFKDFVVKYKDN